MIKPDAMIRALGRAAQVRWKAEDEQRASAIKRIETENRELVEDYFESILPYTKKDIEDLRNFCAFMAGLSE